jgi:hypothetical protein
MAHDAIAKQRPAPDTGGQFANFHNKQFLLLAQAYMNRVVGVIAPGLAIGGVADVEKFELNGAAVCIINGIQQAALTGAPTEYAFTAGHESLGNSEKCRILVIGKTTTGVETRQGPIVPATVDDADVQLPAMPDGWACLGDILIETSSSGVFVFNTTALDHAQVTDTYRDIRWPDSGPSAFRFA